MLEQLYFVDMMSQDQIGRHFGFVDFQPIFRLFKKFNIESRTQREVGQINKMDFPTRDTVAAMIEGSSVLAASKKYKIPYKRLVSCVEHYDLKPVYFVNLKHGSKILSEEYVDNSPKEIAMKLGVGLDVVKYYKKDFNSKIYDVATIFDKIQKYEYDFNSKLLVSQIKFGDSSLYNSILKHTEDHILQSSKFTERLYRLKHNYDKLQSDTCKHCDSKLRFYTYKLGYGCSENQICVDCISKHCGFGVSAVSQKLFSAVYAKIDMTENDRCRFHQLNGEMTLSVEIDDIIKLMDYKNINRRVYKIDFVFNNKIIEFDGTYWHTDKEKETAKDAFVKLKGYEILHINELEYKNHEDETIQKCLSFLNQ